MNIKTKAIIRRMYTFNRYSWLLAIVYLAAAVTMESHSYTSLLEGTYFSAPLILIVIFWSEMSTRIINTDDDTITKKAAFKRDLFLITFGFVVAFTFPLVFEYKNTDALGWWPLVILFGGLYGLFYAFIFSLISLMINHHKKPAIAFIVLIIMLILIENLAPKDMLPRYMSFLFFGEVEFFHVVMGYFLFMYLLFCLGQNGLIRRILNHFKTGK